MQNNIIPIEQVKSNIERFLEKDEWKSGMKQENIILDKSFLQI